jgi:hypothetical protein
VGHQQTFGNVRRESALPPESGHGRPLYEYTS